MTATMDEKEHVPPAPYHVDRATVRPDLPLLLILLVDLVYGLYSLGKMPERVPVHWGMGGQVDRYGPAWMNALLFPGITIAVYLLLLYLPLIDPRRRNYALFADTLRFFRWAIVLLLVGAHVVIVRASLGSSISVDFAARLGMGLLFAALGNRFGTLRQSFFFGIRVPWTISNEEVWNRTHRAAGRLWVAGGLVMAAAAFLPAVPGMVVLVGGLIILSVVPIVHSYLLYRRLAPEGSGE
jgi:immunity protein, SdpI family